MQRSFLFPMFEKSRWAGPYVFCPFNPQQWLVSSIQPIWATNHLKYKNRAIFENNHRYKYDNLSNVIDKILKRKFNFSF